MVTTSPKLSSLQFYCWSVVTHYLGLSIFWTARCTERSEWWLARFRCHCPWTRSTLWVLPDRKLSGRFSGSWGDACGPTSPPAGSPAKATGDVWTRQLGSHNNNNKKNKKNISTAPIAGGRYLGQQRNLLLTEQKRPARGFDVLHTLLQQKATQIQNLKLARQF